MLIQVTQSHLDEGKPGDPCACPVVLALRPYIHPMYLVGVGLSKERNYIVEVYFAHQLPNVECKLDLPKDASEKIANIDKLESRRQKLTPFSFELDIPIQYWSALAHANK